MIRPSFRAATALAVFALPLALPAGAYAPAPGGALANGNVWSLGRAMQVAANQSRYGVAYSGYITLMGRYNNVRFNYPSVYVANATWAKSPDGATRICTAFGDAAFNNQATQLAFTWSQNANDPAQNGVAWKFTKYQAGDKLGKPTGAVVNATESITPLDGRVLVNLPTP